MLGDCCPRQLYHVLESREIAGPRVSSTLRLRFVTLPLCSRGGLNQWSRKDRAKQSPPTGQRHTSSPFHAADQEALHQIRHSMILQLIGMAQRAPDTACRSCLESILACAQESFSIISELATTACIRPFSQIVLAEGGLPVPIEEQPLRIGVYPLAANPLHWGHILVGLTAIASLTLDIVVYLIAGKDSRKPFLLPEQTRHHLGRSVIETFHPLFAYSPLALGTELDGETNPGTSSYVEHSAAHGSFLYCGR